jgi:hypothetical protein
MADRFQFGLKQLILVTISASIGIGIAIRNPDVRGAVVVLLIIWLLLSICLRHYPKTTIVLVVLIGLSFYRVITRTYISTRADRARRDLKLLGMLSESYQVGFGRFPPDSIADSTGNEYFAALQRNSRFSKNDPRQSCWGGRYSFVVVNPEEPEAFCLIIDPGPDKLLGGTLDPQKGFVPDGSDANSDGKPDDQDNIRSDHLDK